MPKPKHLLWFCCILSESARFEAVASSFVKRATTGTETVSFKSRTLRRERSEQGEQTVRGTVWRFEKVVENFSKKLSYDLNRICKIQILHRRLELA